MDEFVGCGVGGESLTDEGDVGGADAEGGGESEGEDQGRGGFAERLFGEGYVACGRKIVSRDFVA